MRVDTAKSVMIDDDRDTLIEYIETLAIKNKRTRMAQITFMLYTYMTDYRSAGVREN